MKKQKITKTAVVAVVGRPNVGKSTLANAFAGEKVTIVSPKPQTTRTRVYAVTSRAGIQFVFVDTPGFHTPKNRLDEYMEGAVKSSFGGADAVLYIIDRDRQDDELERLIRDSAIPAILVINKIDALESKAELLPVIERYSAAFEHIVPISAQKGDGVEGLLELLSSYAKDGEALFPEGMTTDQSDSAVVGELIREKLLICLNQEIPHGTAVEITKFSERIDTEIIDVEATIYCERQSHKRIIIGKNGAALKRVGEMARRDIERFMGAKVFLQTWVKVKEDWRDRPGLIKEFGYVSDR
ncbi:MAG: GTPase Era [Oscillospiraceae bacterium]|jgi:GTP-binding protein Era|nr:GTPase Era [Oscillospiraceae bacterium]